VKLFQLFSSSFETVSTQKDEKQRKETNRQEHNELFHKASSFKTFLSYLVLAVMKRLN